MYIEMALSFTFLALVLEEYTVELHRNGSYCIVYSRPMRFEIHTIDPS